MHKKYNKFLIISFVGVMMLGVYSYFNNELVVFSAEDEDAITSSLDTTMPIAPTSEVSSKTTEDISFLMKLASLTKIKVDTSLFTDPSFKLLIDNNIKLEPAPYGRINPFAPTEASLSSRASAFSLKTNPATLISSNSAVLNGSLDGSSSTNIYFEYGSSIALGKVTSKVTPSLVGNFASNLVGLSAKSPYFFRAVANVNGVITFGEIISFNTN